MRFEENFVSLLVGIDFEYLENYPNTIYGLSRDLTLNYFNPGWFQFAKDNNGEPAISERFKLGTHIGDSITGDARDYYMEAFNRVLQNGKVWHHTYECSSPTLLRKFYQTVYPLDKHKGLLIVNSLVKEEPYGMNDRKPLEALYRQPNGFIKQCCNCRRVQRANDPETWDWVPAWVEKLPENVTHSFCYVCFDFYRLDIGYYIKGEQGE